MPLALPYPSMVFVPLDVLTADELNQIVANYEFIANQFPITLDQIDPDVFEGDVLWENQSPSSNFAGQSVSFSGSAYSYFIIEFERLAGNATRQYSCKLYCPNSTATNISSIQAMIGASNASVAVRYRTFTITNSSCQFNDAYEYAVAADNASTITLNNSYFVPTRIIGINHL